MDLVTKSPHWPLADGVCVCVDEQDAVECRPLGSRSSRVAAGTGEPDRGHRRFTKLFSEKRRLCASSVALTPVLLRLDPMFDPLRNRSRFQKLVALIRISLKTYSAAIFAGISRPFWPYRRPREAQRRFRLNLDESMRAPIHAGFIAESKQ